MGRDGGNVLFLALTLLAAAPNAAAVHERHSTISEQPSFSLLAKGKASKGAGWWFSTAATPESNSSAPKVAFSASDARGSNSNSKNQADANETGVTPWEADAVRTNIAQLRMEASSIEAEKQKLLTKFSQETLEVDDLYSQMKKEVYAATRNMQVATRLCAAIKASAACGHAPFCGWCVVEGECVPGDKLGAFVGLSFPCATYRFGGQPLW
eukprot:gnl/TRDRNA2_/TRDRNA2_39865_c0_seq1.p1 gnl/TRDRNA2_/TRDRNA2_39865_c0~~gnl/TRDRNA2_/TRDRNA2_39865_c0_seq1.p1  ORF type:complete len:211 (-),score=39.43 gnl/TRDRNA2_/TRDRNA2_39865_c0_seq1:22-654(-)